MIPMVFFNSFWVTSLFLKRVQTIFPSAECSDQNEDFHQEYWYNGGNDFDTCYIIFY